MRTAAKPLVMHAETPCWSIRGTTWGGIDRPPGDTKAFVGLHGHLEETHEGVVFSRVSCERRCRASCRVISAGGVLVMPAYAGGDVVIRTEQHGSYLFSPGPNMSTEEFHEKFRASVAADRAWQRKAHAINGPKDRRVVMLLPRAPYADEWRGVAVDVEAHQLVLKRAEEGKGIPVNKGRRFSVPEPLRGDIFDLRIDSDDQYRLVPRDMERYEMNLNALLQWGEEVKKITRKVPKPQTGRIDSSTVGKITAQYDGGRVSGHVGRRDYQSDRLAMRELARELGM